MIVRMRMLILGVALSATTLSACGKGRKADDGGPSCRQIVSYMMRFPEFGAFDERGAIEDCRRQKWNAKQRQCLYTAKDLEAMGKCVPAVKLDPSRPRALPLPSWHPRVDQPLGTPESNTPTEGRPPAAPAPASAAPAPAAPAPAAPASAAPASAPPAAKPR